MDIGIDEVRYLGDGVYVKYDGYHLILTANVPTTDTIHLDVHVRSALRELLMGPESKED